LLNCGGLFSVGIVFLKQNIGEVKFRSMGLTRVLGFVRHLRKCLIRHVDEHDSAITRWGILVLIFAFPIAASFGQWWERFSGLHVKWIWTAAIVYTSFRVLWHSYLEVNEQQNKAAELQNRIDTVIHDRACLEIIFKDEPPMWNSRGFSEEYICKVGVKNNSRTKTAKNVRLRLVSVSGSTILRPPAALLSVASQSGESRDSIDVPPNSEPTFFDFFNVSIRDTLYVEVAFSSGHSLRECWIENLGRLNWTIEVQCTGEDLETKPKKFDLRFPFEAGKHNIHLVEAS
jgi:hypothetical protein